MSPNLFCLFLNQLFCKRNPPSWIAFSSSKYKLLSIKNQETTVYPSKISLSSMDSQIERLHFLLIPLLAQSHIIPLTDFAKLLARRGVFVSIITTPRNATRYESIINLAKTANLKIQLIPLKFPGQEFGLPEGCENMDTLTSIALVKPFLDACKKLEKPLENLIEEMEPKPNCIISTNALPWTQELAQKCGIPSYIFQTVSCFTVFCSRVLSDSKVQERVNSDSDSFLVPNIPHKIEFTKSQLPENERKKSSDDTKGVIEHMEKVQKLARGTLINSFEELEPWYVEESKKITKNLWCIGPVSLCNKELAEKLNRGDNKSSIDEHNCLKWLDSMKPRSVIYACFGSLCRISPHQLKEIGLGLESSNRPFIWIIRELDISSELEKWLEDEKLEERIIRSRRGLIIRGWAPQVLILSHPSIGGFLTHCGWNSTLEGICAGVPMITWPMFSEQFYNEKFILNVVRIGVRIGAEATVKIGEEMNRMVKREMIKEAINEVMDEGIEGMERRKRAEELREMAKNAIEEKEEEGGSSYLNISYLIQDVLLCNKHLKEGKVNSV